MTDKEKADLLFKIWISSDTTKTEFAQKCGWKSSSIFCKLISGKTKVTYEHLEKACKVMGIDFNLKIEK